MLKTSEELSKLYGVPGRQIRRWIAQGKIVSQKQEALTRGYLGGYRHLIEENELREFLKTLEQNKQKGKKVLKTVGELSKLYGVWSPNIRRGIREGKLKAQKEECPRGYRYLIDEDECKEFLKTLGSRNKVGLPKRENSQTAKREWVEENASNILAHFLACNKKQGTARHFGLNGYYLCVAFHIAGRDDLVQPCHLKNITNAYPIKATQEVLEALATTPNLLQSTLVPIKPSGDNFHANLIAFFKEVEENDKKIIELQEQVETLTTGRNNYKEEVVKLRSILVQAKEMMARGD